MSWTTDRVLRIIDRHRSICIEGVNLPLDKLPSNQRMWYAKQIRILDFVEDDIRTEFKLPNRKLRDDE